MSELTAGRIGYPSDGGDRGRVSLKNAVPTEDGGAAYISAYTRVQYLDVRRPNGTQISDVRFE